MKAEARVVRPDDVEVQITLTARVKDWKDLMAQLPTQWPAWDVERAIRESLRTTLEAVGSADTATLTETPPNAR